MRARLRPLPLNMKRPIRRLLNLHIARPCNLPRLSQAMRSRHLRRKPPFPPRLTPRLQRVRSVSRSCKLTPRTHRPRLLAGVLPSNRVLRRNLWLARSRRLRAAPLSINMPKRNMPKRQARLFPQRDKAKPHRRRRAVLSRRALPLARKLGKPRSPRKRRKAPLISLSRLKIRAFNLQPINLHVTNLRAISRGPINRLHLKRQAIKIHPINRARLTARRPRRRLLAMLPIGRPPMDTQRLMVTLKAAIHLMGIRKAALNLPRQPARLIPVAPLVMHRNANAAGRKSLV